MKKLLAAAMLVLAGAGPAAAQDGASLKILTPGYTYFSGVIDLAKGYQKEKGVKVDIQVQGMGGMLAQAKATTPPADIIFLPPNLMDQLEADKGIVPGSRVPLGRVRMAVAVHKGDPVPDISTVAKLAAVLKSADSVMRSNPAGGSMVAAIIEKMLQRPEFAGVKSRISTNGEGGEAVARGEGQMAIQAECEILNHPDQLTDVGPVPDELGAYMDAVVAVSSRSTHPKEAAAWIKYATQPGTYSLWLGRGLERVK